MSTSMSVQKSNFLVGLALLLFLASAVSGGYACYWFFSAQQERAAIEQRWRERQQPGNAQATGIMDIASILSGIGPAEVEIAGVLVVRDREAAAWKYFAIALAFAFAGNVVLRRAWAGQWVDPLADAPQQAQRPLPVVQYAVNPQLRGKLLRRLAQGGALLAGCLLLTFTALYIWPGFLRPLPRAGIAMSGRVGYMLSDEHYQAIQLGMTLDEVQEVIDIAQKRLPLDPWITNVPEATRIQTEIGANNLKLIQHSQNHMPAWQDFWFSFDGNGRIIEVRMKGGKVVDKKLLDF